MQHPTIDADINLIVLSRCAQERRLKAAREVRHYSTAHTALERADGASLSVTENIWAGLARS